MRHTHYTTAQNTFRPGARTAAAVDLINLIWYWELERNLQFGLLERPALLVIAMSHCNVEGGIGETEQSFIPVCLLNFATVSVRIRCKWTQLAWSKQRKAKHREVKEDEPRQWNSIKMLATTLTVSKSPFLNFRQTLHEWSLFDCAFRSFCESN